MGKVELLAPAGNFECLIAAVQSGADAVYIAGTNFGARSFADNFNKMELEEAVDYCHIRNVKVYITVNTLVLDSEISELGEYLVFLAKIGVDAIIVQDMGVLKVAREIVPDLPVHASTQMTVHNADGVLCLKKFGIKRVVLSRELSISQIRSIAEKTDVELEVFAHGALCMCYSGQCLLSSIIGSRSGNRGKCAQPCRLPYSINNSKEKAFFMSFKDLCSLWHLPTLTDAGVSSLKIEGRMKGPAYVAAVVGIYRKYIDKPQKVDPADIELLDTIFNRGGLTDGYLTGSKGKEMFALNKPENPYRKGSVSLEKKLLASVAKENIRKKLNGKIIIRENQNPVMEIDDGKVFVRYIHENLPEKAIKTALCEDTVISHISKTGGTPFEFDSISVELDDGLFLTAGDLNKIRRRTIEKFKSELTESFKRKIDEVKPGEILSGSFDDGGYVCEITTVEQMKAVLQMPFERFYIPFWIIRSVPDIADRIKDKTVIALPAILTDSQQETVVSGCLDLLESGYSGVLIHNMSLIDRFKGYNVYGGFRLNIFNSHALKFFGDLNLKVAELSPELTLKQIKDMSKSVPVQVMVYGRLPLMVSENCIIKNKDFCPCNGDNTITDRMGMTFPVIKDGDICRSVILNCKKTFMAFDMDKIKKTGVNCFRIYFTDETAEECRKICNTFLFGGDFRPEDFTKGHFFKGVEKQEVRRA